MQLFDNSGRRIPSQGLYNINVASRRHYLDQPMQGYLPSFWYYHRFATVPFDYLASSCDSAHEFACRSRSLIRQIQQNPVVSGVLNGVCLPICLPRLNIDDYSESLNDKFVPLVQRVFAREFQGRQLFENRLIQHLPERLTINPESRHHLLIERMENESVVALYCPTALQGYSVKAARSQIADLPKNFLLSGGVDVAVAMAMYPRVLGRDGCRGHRQPNLVLPSLSLNSGAGYRLSVSSWDGVTRLDESGSINEALADDAPGLLIIEDT